MERTCGDGKQVVLREVDEAWLSCLQGRVNAAFLKTGILLCKIAEVKAIPCSSARFAISAFCTSVNFVYDSVFDFKVFCCSLYMFCTSAFAAEIEEDRMSVASAPWGSGSF